jgi:hypothetical protein
VVISNYYESKNSLDNILSQIKINNINFELLVYNLDENFYLTDDEMLLTNSQTKEKIGKSISEIFNGYYYFSYFRHLIFTLLQ